MAAVVEVVSTVAVVVDPMVEAGRTAAVTNVASPSLSKRYITHSSPSPLLHEAGFSSSRTLPLRNAIPRTYNSSQSFVLNIMTRGVLVPGSNEI